MLKKVEPWLPYIAMAILSALAWNEMKPYIPHIVLMSFGWLMGRSISNRRTKDD